MICPKCHMKGKIKDRYCEKCGLKLQFEMPKISKKMKLVLLTVISILVVFVSIFFIGYYLTSPSYVAKKYFESVIQNDIHTIYEKIGGIDSTFVSEKILQEKVDIFEHVDTYHISSIEENGRTARVLITYYLENDSKTYQVSVDLYRNHAKKWLIYPNWKVDSAYIAKNVVFEVPTNSKVTVDGKKLTDFQNIEQSTDAYDVYQIPKMIAGTYTVQVTLPIGTIIDQKIEMEDAKRITVGDFELSDETREKIETTALQNLQILYDGAIQNQTYDMIQDKLVSTKSHAQIGKRYRTFKSSIQGQNVTFTNVKIASVEVTSAYYNRNGKFTTTLEIVHHDSYTYDKNGEIITAEKTDRTSKITIVWTDDLQIVDLEWK